MFIEFTWGIKATKLNMFLFVCVKATRNVHADLWIFLNFSVLRVILNVLESRLRQTY